MDTFVSSNEEMAPPVSTSSSMNGSAREEYETLKIGPDRGHELKFVTTQILKRVADDFWFHRNSVTGVDLPRRVSATVMDVRTSYRVMVTRGHDRLNTSIQDINDSIDPQTYIADVPPVCIEIWTANQKVMTAWLGDGEPIISLFSPGAWLNTFGLHDRIPRMGPNLITREKIGDIDEHEGK